MTNLTEQYNVNTEEQWNNANHDKTMGLKKCSMYETTDLEYLRPMPKLYFMLECLTTMNP